MSLNFRLILNRAGKKFKLKSMVDFENNIPEYLFNNHKSESIWMEALSGEFVNAAGIVHRKTFLPHKSLLPMAVETKKGWELNLSQFGVPFHTIKIGDNPVIIGETKDVDVAIELIPRGKTFVLVDFL